MEVTDLGWVYLDLGSSLDRWAKTYCPKRTWELIGGGLSHMEEAWSGRTPENSGRAQEIPNLSQPNQDPRSCSSFALFEFGPFKILTHSFLR